MDQITSKKLRVISFLSIVLVVCLHGYNLEKAPELKNSFVWVIENYISNGLTRIAVPIFFIISGYFFFKNFKTETDYFVSILKKKSKTILVPFLFWSILGVLIYFVLQSIPPLLPFFTKKLLKDYTFFELIKTIFVNPIPYQLWFMRDLMVFVLVSPIIVYLLKKAPLFVVVVNILLWVLISNEFQNSIEAFLFFTTGGIISIYKPEILKIDLSNKTILLVVFWLFLCLCKVFLEYMAISQLLITVIHKISIVLGIIAFWGVYDLIKTDYFEKKQFKFLISFTFFLYVFHEPLLTIIKKLLFSIIGKTENGHIIVYFSSILITIGITLLIGYVFKTLLKPLYLVVTGDR